MNAVLRPVAPANARNWRNPAGRRPQDGEPDQAPVGGDAAVVASGCWQAGSKRDQTVFLSEGTVAFGGARRTPYCPKIGCALPLETVACVAGKRLSHAE